MYMCKKLKLVDIIFFPLNPENVNVSSYYLVDLLEAALTPWLHRSTPAKST